MKKLILASALSMASFGVNAGNLWIIGDATPYGWSCDDATALLSTVENPSVYSGTIYLKAGYDFKFMTIPDFGNEEYGAAPGASIEDGMISLAKGTDDNGYSKLQVTENANYLICVNTDDMTATIEKSAYQETEIKLSSLFLIGDATEGGWSVDNGTPLLQDPAAPYIYKRSELKLTNGSFKIATVIKGGGTFADKYFYFRDAENANKIALGQAGDLQWSITEEGTYNITVNTIDNTIDIVNSISSVVLTPYSDNDESHYYNLNGQPVMNPSDGVFVKVSGNKTEKIIMK